MPKPMHMKSASSGFKAPTNNQVHLGSIGWGIADLGVSPNRVVIDYQPHKNHLDQERTSLFTKVDGNFSSIVDKKLGISLDAFQNLDMRSLRLLVKQRVWQQSNKMKHVYLNSSSHHLNESPMIDYKEMTLNLSNMNSSTKAGHTTMNRTPMPLEKTADSSI